MKFTPEEEAEMKKFRPEAKKLIKKCKHLTYGQVRFRLENLAEEYADLPPLKFGNDWICRIRKDLGFVNQSISYEFKRKNLAKEIKRRLKNSFITCVATSQVVKLWKKELSETPTKANLRDFRTEFDFDTKNNAVKKHIQDTWYIVKK